MTQAPTPGPLSGDDELIERGLRSIRTYDAVRSLRDALTATTARLTGYDWNADPDAITKQQGDAFAAADKVFADLDAAVAAPDLLEIAVRILDRGYVSSSIEEEREDHLALRAAISRATGEDSPASEGEA